MPRLALSPVRRGRAHRFGHRRCRPSRAACRGRADSFHIEGGGFGHGVGMSQYGALGYAQQGWSYQRHPQALLHRHRHHSRSRRSRRSAHPDRRRHHGAGRPTITPTRPRQHRAAGQRGGDRRGATRRSASTVVNGKFNVSVAGDRRSRPGRWRRRQPLRAVQRRADRARQDRPQVQVRPARTERRRRQRSCAS